MDEQKTIQYLLIRGLIVGNYEPFIQTQEAVRSIFFYLCAIIIGTVIIISMTAIGAISIGIKIDPSYSTIVFVVVSFAISLFAFISASPKKARAMLKLQIEALDNAVKDDIDFKEVSILKEYFPTKN